MKNKANRHNKNAPDFVLKFSALFYREKCVLKAQTPFYRRSAQRLLCVAADLHNAPNPHDVLSVREYEIGGSAHDNAAAVFGDFPNDFVLRRHRRIGERREYEIQP